MNKTLEIQLNEQDVKKAIEEYIAKHQNLKVKKMVIRTGVRGDYDKGNAIEYVEKVWCECE